MRLPILHPHRAPLMTSLNGIKELYLIILGIGITEGLVNIPTLECSWTFICYLLVLVGFLSTVFRFALEAILFLEDLLQLPPVQWTPSCFMMTIMSLASGLLFYLMGHNLNHFEQFMGYTILLLALDLGTLCLIYQPWRHHLSGLITALVSIMTCHRCFPSFNPVHPNNVVAFDKSAQLLRQTHYQWVRSNLILALLLIGLMFYWKNHTFSGTCPVGFPTSWDQFNQWVHYLPQKLWISQLTLGVLLTSFSIWDIVVNHRYYFQGWLDSHHKSPMDADEEE